MRASAVEGEQGRGGVGRFRVPERVGEGPWYSLEQCTVCNFDSVMY
jgi:hypothetical protein